MKDIVLYWGGLKSKGLTLLKCRHWKSLPCVETNYPRTIDARRYSHGCQSPNSNLKAALFRAILSFKPTSPDANTLHEGHFKVQIKLKLLPACRKQAAIQHKVLPQSSFEKHLLEGRVIIEKDIK